MDAVLEAAAVPKQGNSFITFNNIVLVSVRGTDLESREASLYLLAKLCTGVLNVPVTTYICLLTLKFIIYKWNALLRL